jgi:hypothetical protein
VVAHRVRVETVSLVDDGGFESARDLILHAAPDRVTYRREGMTRGRVAGIVGVWIEHSAKIGYR